MSKANWIPTDIINQLPSLGEMVTWTAPKKNPSIIRYAVVILFVKPVNLGGAKPSHALVEMHTTKAERDKAYKKLKKQAHPNHREWRTYRYKKPLKKVGRKFFVRA